MKYKQPWEKHAQAVTTNKEENNMLQKLEQQEHDSKILKEKLVKTESEIKRAMAHRHTNNG